jgi:hypothetical protein
MISALSPGGKGVGASSAVTRYVMKIMEFIWKGDEKQ